MPAFQTVRGTRDLLPIKAKRLRFIMDTAEEIAELYGYKEVITPLLESYELLNAKSGEEIRSRMFVFKDLGNRKIVLRPEFTASIARLVTTTLKKSPLPLRFFSVGTVYRYDEPQHGRYREFWQSNFELMGSRKVEADVEIILLTNRFMKKVKLNNYAFKLGHIGILRGIMNQEGISEKIQSQILQKMDKKEYNAALKLIHKRRCKLVFNSLRFLNERNVPSFSENPFEIIESTALILRDYEEALVAVENLRKILKKVEEAGCKIKTVDPVFARGLEYYTGMIFEVYVPELDIALGGGGRYDKLIETFGGEPTPAVGVAHGLDRISLAKRAQTCENRSILIKKTLKKRVWVIPANQKSKITALKISEQLREKGIKIELEIMGRKLDKALKKAKVRKVDYAVIVDTIELPKGKVILQNLLTRTREKLTINQLLRKLKQSSKKNKKVFEASRTEAFK